MKRGVLLLALLPALARAEGPTPIFLQALAPTSGANASAVLDGDAKTGWKPVGDPRDEGLLFRFDTPVRVDAVAVTPCPGIAGSMRLDVSTGGNEVATISAQTTASPAQPVTVDNYNRAQTDVYFAGVVRNGGFGKFRHGRELATPVQQGIVRPNRDTLYSLAVFDLDAGPVAITLPEPGKRFMGMQIANEDQYTRATYYGAGSHTLTSEMIGTRYAIAVVRFLVNYSNK